MGESLQRNSGEMRNVPHVDGSRFITVGPDTSYSETVTLQASLALQEWFDKHPDETRGVDFVNPRESDRSLQVDALTLWNGDLDGETLRGRCRAFVDSLASSKRTSRPYDLAKKEDREQLLTDIRNEHGVDEASLGTVH